MKRFSFIVLQTELFKRAGGCHMPAPSSSFSSFVIIYVITLLSEYIGASRLDRAKEIKDIEIIELSKDKIIADVRGYSVYIDVEKRFILHDCGDWRRTHRGKPFCKHIAALILALPEEAAGFTIKVTAQNFDVFFILQ